MSFVESFRWSLRRLRIPSTKEALVLEVGSGGNPYPRANVLLDAYEETRERHWEPLIHDHPTVLAFGENLPFKDKSFDFVIAAHVLEHTPDPEKFLAELQRVGRAGYIETPDAFMERINPYKDHRLEVTLRDDCLVIRKKAAWTVDTELDDLYQHRAKRWVTQELIPGHPADFHVRYYWKDTIKYRVLNPEVNASWKPVDANASPVHGGGLKQTIRHMILNIFRWVFSQGNRNKHIDLLSVLRCPQCHGADFQRQAGRIVCGSCGAGYEMRNRVCVMQSRELQTDSRERKQ